MKNKELIEKLKLFPDDADVDIARQIWSKWKPVEKVTFEPAMDALPGWITIK